MPLGRLVKSIQGKRAAKARADAAVTQLRDAARQAIRDGRITSSDFRDISELAAGPHIPPERAERERRRLEEQRVEAALAKVRSETQQALDDGWVTEAEFAKVSALPRTLSIPRASVSPELTLLEKQVQITRIMEGDLPETIATGLVLRRNEVCHLEMPTKMYEERVRRKYRSGHSGASVRVAKGVYWHVGGSRGSSEPVLEMSEIDAGDLTITSRRIVFTGQRRTTTLDLRKLVRIEPHKDAVQVYVENRQKAPAFIVRDPDVVGATILAAAQKLADA